MRILRIYRPVFKEKSGYLKHLKRILGDDYARWRPQDDELRKRCRTHLQEHYNITVRGEMSPLMDTMPLPESTTTPHVHMNMTGSQALDCAAVQSNIVQTGFVDTATYNPSSFDEQLENYTDSQVGEMISFRNAGIDNIDKSDIQQDFPMGSEFDDIIIFPDTEKDNDASPNIRPEYPLDSGFDGTVASTDPQSYQRNVSDMQQELLMNSGSCFLFNQLLADENKPLTTGDQSWSPTSSVNHISDMTPAQKPEFNDAERAEILSSPPDTFQNPEEGRQEQTLRNRTPNTQSFASSSGSSLRRDSQLSDFLKRIPKCSLEEQRLIKETLRLSAAQRFSSLSDSVSACFHRERESLVDIFPLPSESSRIVSFRNPDRQRLDMPGDFLTSHINTFPRHIHCHLRENQRQDLIFCTYCLRNPPSLPLKMIYGIPLAVLNFKRGKPVDEETISIAKPWSDRFGNRSLQIVAALGVKYSTLESVMNGANLHALNTGLQSFMHVIDFQRWTLKDMISLRERLKKKKFQFHQMDLQGLTFVEYLKEGNMKPLEFAKCWLELMIQKERFNERITNNEWIRKIFKEKGGTSEQWASLNWKEHGLIALNSSAPLTEIFEAKIQIQKLVQNPKGFLLRLKVANNNRDIKQFAYNISTYRSTSNQNCLHLAVTAAFEHSPNLQREQQSQFREFGLGLVSVLIHLRVDIHHRDESGETPLMALLRSSLFRVDVLEYFLRYGANPNQRNRQGDSPLHLSVSLGNHVATEMLIKYVANIHARNAKGIGIAKTALLVRKAAGKDFFVYIPLDTCCRILQDAGAVDEPNLQQEWDLAAQPSSRTPLASLHKLRRIFSDSWMLEFLEGL